MIIILLQATHRHLDIFVGPNNFPSIMGNEEKKYMMTSSNLFLFFIFYFPFLPFTAKMHLILSCLRNKRSIEFPSILKNT